MHTVLFSEHPATVKVLRGQAQCRTLQKRTFILRFLHFHLDRAGKRPF